MSEVFQDDGHASAGEALRFERRATVGRQGHGARLLNLRREAQRDLTSGQGRIRR